MPAVIGSCDSQKRPYSLRTLHQTCTGWMEESGTVLTVLLFRDVMQQLDTEVFRTVKLGH